MQVQTHIADILAHSRLKHECGKDDRILVEAWRMDMVGVFLYFHFSEAPSQLSAPRTFVYVRAYQDSSVCMCVRMYVCMYICMMCVRTYVCSSV